MEHFLFGLKNKLKAIQDTGTELHSSLCVLSWTSQLCGSCYYWFFSLSTLNLYQCFLKAINLEGTLLKICKSLLQIVSSVALGLYSCVDYEQYISHIWHYSALNLKTALQRKSIAFFPLYRCGKWGKTISKFALASEYDLLSLSSVLYQIESLCLAINRKEFIIFLLHRVHLATLW